MKKNRNLLFVLLVCALVAFVVFAACDPDDVVQSKVLDHIDLDTANMQTEFEVGDLLNYQGLEVTAHYDDDTSAIVAGYTVTVNGLDDDGKLTANSNEVTVAYTEEDVTKSATYGITVTAGSNPDDDPGKDNPIDQPKNVESIEITKLPTTTLYYVGDTFSTADMEIEVTYDDDTTENLTSGFNASASTAMSGEKTITVSYKGATDTFTITVYNKLTGLDVTGKRGYTIGDEFEGIIVTALYNGKISGGVELDESAYTWSINPALNDGKLDTAGKYTITVEYSEEKIAGNLLEVDEMFEITVSNPDDPDAIAWGEEGASVDEWKYWSDEATVVVSEVKFVDKEDGVNIHATFDGIGSLYYGFQLFYNDLTSYKLYSSYTLTLTITSKTDCTVVINDKSCNLTANEPTEVEVAFTYTYNGFYTGMSLFDMQVDIVAGESYDITLSNIVWTSNQGSNPGGGDDPIVPGGDDYVVTLTNTYFYNDMYIRLSMSAKDFALVSSAAKVVVNGNYTGDNWSGGFLVDGNVFIHVRLVGAGPAPAGTYTLVWYDADNNVIAYCSVTI